MPRRWAPRGSAPRPRHRVALLAVVVALVVADGVLVAAAAARQSGEPGQVAPPASLWLASHASSAATPVSAGASASPSSIADAGASSSASPPVALGSAAPPEAQSHETAGGGSGLLPAATTLLTAWDGQVAWRAEVGSCDQAGRVWRTTDGGATWEQAGEPGLAPLVRLRATAAGGAFAVGGGAQCAPALMITDDSGGSWRSQPSSLAGTWYINPAERGDVVSPAGTHSIACAAGLVDLVSASRAAAMALCADRTLVATTDTAASWHAVGPVEGARAIGSAQDGYVVAAQSAHCDGVVVVALGVDGELGDTGCAPVHAVTAADITISQGDGVTWVVVGEDVTRSTNGLAGWT